MGSGKGVMTGGGGVVKGSKEKGSKEKGTKTEVEKK